MNNSQVAHLWAHQAKPQGKGSHFYFEGDTIYSYGSHFPIARHVDGVVLFTTRGYSVTTAHHISMARRAASHLTTYMVTDPTVHPSQGDVENYREWINKAALDTERSRKYIESCLNHMLALIDEANHFCYHFNFSTRFSVPSNIDLDALKAKAAESAKREREARAKAQAKLEAEIQETIAQWLTGAPVQISYRASQTYLRAVGDTVETSRGAVIPLADAHKAFRFAKLHRSSPWRRNGEQFAVGSYQLDAVNEFGIIAGCHRIAWNEIDRFATSQNW